MIEYDDNVYYYGQIARFVRNNKHYHTAWRCSMAKTYLVDSENIGEDWIDLLDG